MPMKVGVARETAQGERRVALVPEALGKLTAAGLEVLVEAGAGAGAMIPDQAYTDAGATVVSTGDLYAGSDVVLRVQKPSAEEAARLRSGQTRRGPADAAARPRPDGDAGVRRGDRGQPRRDPAHAVAGPDDGRPVLAGEHRRLQGRPHRREHVRALLPAADDRGRHRQARQRPDPGHRRRRAPGDRDGAAARRGRVRVRRPTRDGRAGPEPGREVREAQDRDRRHRRRRLRPRADRGGAGRPAGRPQRGHRQPGRRHHHGPGPRAQAPAARDRGRRARDEARARSSWTWPRRRSAATASCRRPARRS